MLELKEPERRKITKYFAKETEEDGVASVSHTCNLIY